MDDSKIKVECETPTPGKKSTKIHKWKYETISKTILDLVPAKGEGLPFKDLAGLVSNALDEEMKAKIGSIGWYTTTVKLDLECKNRLFRIPESRPQKLLKEKPVKVGRR